MPTGVQQFTGSGGAFVVNLTDIVYLVELRVRVTVSPDQIDVYDRLGAHPSQVRYIARILEQDDPEDENAVVWLESTPSNDAFDAVSLALALVDNPTPRLSGGTDGDLATPDDIAGAERRSRRRNEEGDRARGAGRDRRYRHRRRPGRRHPG